MRIWEIFTVRDNNIYLTGDEEELEKLYDYYFEGELIKDDWDSSLQLYIDRNKKYTVASDVPMFSDSYFIVNNRALKVFKSLAEKEIECLEFFCKEEKYTIINPITVLDCIDMEKSKYKLYKGDSDTIQSFEKLYFNHERILNSNIFRLKHHEAGFFVCSDKFKNEMESQKIKGLGFHLLSEE